MSSSSATDLFHAGHPRRLIPELCRHYYGQGWFAGAGGGISMKVGDSIYMAPSAVPIDRIETDDLFVLRKDGTVAQSPANAAKAAAPDKKLALSHCSPLFMHAYKREFDFVIDCAAKSH